MTFKIFKTLFKAIAELFDGLKGLNRLNDLNPTQSGPNKNEN